MSLQFEWDPRKNPINIQKHELDFSDADLIFRQPMLIRLDDREDYGEDRWVGIGLLNLHVVVIVFTEPYPNTIRVISLRKATGYERKRYEQVHSDEFGTP